MRHFCKCTINQKTGEIEHVVVSDAPLAADLQLIPTQKPDLAAIPPIPPTIFRIEDIEFESVDGTFMHGDKVLNAMRVSGADTAARRNPSAKPELVTGAAAANIKNMVNV